MDEKCRGDEQIELMPFVLPRTVSSAEESAMQCLGLLDLSGARSAVGALLAEAISTAPDPRHASYLLYDLLSRIDRFAAAQAGLPQRGIGERLTLVRRLAGCRSAEDLVASFWLAFDEMTAALGSLSPPGHPAVEQVKAYVRKNYMHKIALSDIADAVGISRNYLSHLFKRHCGLTVTEFIQRTRMKEAEELLMNGGKTVSEIGYLVGYQNYRDFHRNFVKYQKTSPKKFRQFRAYRKVGAQPPSL